MKIAVCVEKSGGISFNNRPVSRDRVLLEKLAALAGEGRVLFEKDISAVSSEENIYFMESDKIPMEKVSQIYLFRWNRDYPADVYFNYDLKELGFTRVKKEDFAGFSHKKITLEIYQKR